MFWLKACPRCRGDLHEESDFYGPYVACMQCGYTLTNEQEEQLRAYGEIEREAATPAQAA